MQAAIQKTVCFPATSTSKLMSAPPALLFPNTTSLPVFVASSHKLYQQTQQNLVVIPTLLKRASSALLSLPPHSIHCSLQSDLVGQEEDDDDDETIIGDCLVFEEGIFDDPFLQDESFKPQKNPTGRGNLKAEVVPQNLIPEKWVEMQRELNITKKERRKLARQLEFGRKIEKRREIFGPLERGRMRTVESEEFVKYRDERLKQLNPVVLDKPKFLKVEKEEKGDEEVTGSVQGSSEGAGSSTRVKPRNPRLAVYGGGLDDISEFFNSGNYDPNAAKNTEGIFMFLC